MLFNKKELTRLIMPLIVEQFLAMTVGLADMIMVANAGEAAVSGISLVDTINILLINVLTALATGGAVVAAQYLGHKDKKNGCVAANQLLFITTLISVFIMVFALIFNKGILHLIYNGVEAEVMKNAIIYFYLSALSYPFLAMYNSGAALYRAMGNSKISMIVSLIMNVINIIGNAIFIYGLHMGVEGAAIASLISRITAAIIILIIIRNPKNKIHVDERFRLGYKPAMIKRILKIGIPNGLENSMFQFGKILVQGIVAAFGTTAITANAVSGTVANVAVIPGMAISTAMITVVGQCVGAGDYEQAKAYTKKLIKISYLLMAVINVLVILLKGTILAVYQLSPETTQIATEIILYHSICAVFIWTPSFTLPNALRAANDVKYPMIVSMISMWACRVVMCYVLSINFHMGVLGVWVGMTLDWAVRAVCFLIRFSGTKWQTYYK